MKKYLLAITLLFSASSMAFSQSEPPYGMSELQAYSIFYENYRTGDYDMALQFGKWMLEKKPKEIEGINRFNLASQYDRMINVYTEISKEASDPSMRSAYLDTALIVYQDVFETFDENEIDYYEWHFNLGRFYQENQSNIDDGLNKAYAEYENAYELDAERLVQSGDGYYIQILLNKYVSDEDRDKALQVIDEVEPMAGESLTNAMNEIRNNLFTNPEERIEFLEGRLEDAPEDLAIITELATMYTDLGDRANAISYAERAYEIEPSFENARRLADYAKADGENQRAIQFLTEALELTDDTDTQKRVLIEVSELHQNEGNLQQARQLARQARQVDESWGQPLIQIAGIYASAISQCTSGRQMERDDRTVYWLVMDYLDRAQSIDSSVANTANRLKRTYEPVLPTAEDKFFSGWEAGDSFTVGANISDCYAWIGETTTVR